MTPRAWRALLGLWAVVAFTATHIPLDLPPPPRGSLLQADKLVHFAIYAGMGFFAIRAGLAASLGLLPVAGLLLVYAAVDELSQIPVGRDANLYDWIADAAGVTAGLVFAARGRAARGPLNPHENH